MANYQSIGNAALSDSPVVLFPDALEEAMSARLLRAAERLSASGDEWMTTTRELRAQQNDVFTNVVDYVIDAATHPATEGNFPYGRIILPPRTGKTVIAGEIIARTCLTTTFVVPTLPLADQAVKEFRFHLPNALVGALYGDHEEVVPYGINITTYPMMQSRMKSNSVPDAIRTSGLVFVDEGHHATTEQRMDFLQHAFDPRALRIALTATPDYNELRISRISFTNSPFSKRSSSISSRHYVRG